MTDALRLIGQVGFYVIVCAVIGYFASSPDVHLVKGAEAQIKMSLAHSAARTIECRRLTSEEIAKLPPSERRPNTCGRERLPMRVQLLVDGKTLYDATVEPLGWSRDGPARIYEKLVVPAGKHTIIARLNDRGPVRNGNERPATPETAGGAGEFNYVKEVNIDLKPRQNLAIDFKADEGGFIFY